MLFNSFAFCFFLPIVFLLYWFLFNKHKDVRNLFLVLVSYVFYAWWDWRFLGLIIISSLVDFFVGKSLASVDQANKRKLLLACSLIVNLGILGFFKYFNFFIGSFAEMINSTGLQSNLSSLKIILPVGVSFYTFQTLSYTIDIYRKQLKPTDNIISFFAFVSFFPQLVAGPIERAKNLLPQFNLLHKFNYENAVDGCKMILWGFFKKIAIADVCAGFVNQAFGNNAHLGGADLFVGAVFFSFQIYGDFSGYSLIARGIAKLFGFNLMQNFRQPYFARNISEHWRRWHISLSTWFRDYVYIPLGGNVGGKLAQFRNIMIVFTVSGLWHGANWTFVFWGFLHGLFYLPAILRNNTRKYMGIIEEGKLLPSMKTFSAMLGTYLLACFSFIFFRADNISFAFEYIFRIITRPLIFKYNQMFEPSCNATNYMPFSI